MIRIKRNKRRHPLMLTEGVQTKRTDSVKKYLIEQCPDVNDKDEAWELIKQIKKVIPNCKLQKCKFLLGVCRLLFENTSKRYVTKISGIYKIRLNAYQVDMLDKTLKYVADESHVNEYNEDLNGLTYDELIRRFKPIKIAYLTQLKKELSEKKYTKRNPKYTIIPIKTFNEAKHFAKYTDWCVTTKENMFDHYTDDNKGMFYFCLTDDFKNIEEPENPSTIYDKYGLSMIAVSVDRDGNPNTITTRYNHEHGGTDMSMTPQQISDLLGASFFDLFPNTNTQDTKETNNNSLDNSHAIFSMMKTIRDKMAECLRTNKNMWNSVVRHYNDKRNQKQSEQNVYNDVQSMHQKLSQILQDTLKQYNITNYSLHDDCSYYEINVNDNIIMIGFPHVVNFFKIKNIDKGMLFYACFDDEYERLFRPSKYEFELNDLFKYKDDKIQFIKLYNKIEASYEVYFCDEKNPYYEMDYPNCYINKDNKIILIKDFYEFKMVDLSDYYFYEISNININNQTDWRYNLTVKHRNKILFNDEVNISLDRYNRQAHFVTKNDKSFTLDLTKTKNIINDQDCAISYSETPFKLIDAK